MHAPSFITIFFELLLLLLCVCVCACFVIKKTPLFIYFHVFTDPEIISLIKHYGLVFFNKICLKQCDSICKAQAYKLLLDTFWLCS